MSEPLTSPPTVVPPRPPRLPVPGEGAVRWAWISLVFYLPSFIASFVLGEVLLSWYGYGDDESAPFWADLGAAGPALLVFSVPGILAVYLGRRAMRQGNRAGLTPAVIGATIALGVIALNVVSGIASALFG